MTHTRVMATIADNRATEQFVRELHAAGMEGVRINSAHVTPEAIRTIIATVRAVDPAIVILMDTKGPEMRTTALEPGIESVRMDAGAEVRVCGGDAHSGSSRIFVNAPAVGSCLASGDRLFIDDGEIELKIKRVENDNTLLCKVIRAGVLGSRKSVNASEGAKLPPMPAVSEKDRVNIKAALECGIDIIAHSFVRTADDVRQVREELGSSAVKLFAKVETREALDNLEAIADAADGLLVARGDLGAQIPLCEVPAAQMRIMALCKTAGKSTIISTQMLDSMMRRPQPTRAEVSDIAFGVCQGADWLLLTGETAKGDYPAEAVSVMHGTIAATEKYLEPCSVK